ncbi:MAG: outer membrane beta-barrel protein [Sulfuriferula sp.]
MKITRQKYALRPIAAIVSLLFASWGGQPVMAAQPDTVPAGTASQAGTAAQTGSGSVTDTARTGIGAPDTTTTTATSTNVVQPEMMPAQRNIKGEPLFEGIVAGSFLLFPSVDLSLISDDNIYGTRTQEARDLIVTLTPSIVARSNWEKHRLNFTAGVSADHYDKYGSENVTDWWLGTDGRYDLSDRSNLFGGLRATQEHEDRASPEAQLAGGSEPTTYTTMHANMGFAHRFDKINLRTAVVEEKLDYNNPVGMTAGTTNNDRDRTLRSVGVRVGVPISEKNEVFAQAATDQRTYDQTVDDNGYQRSSDGYRVSVGARSKIASNMQAEGFVGQMTQNYDDARLPDVSKPYYGGRFTWQPDNRTRISALLDRSINETTLPGASSYVDTTVTGKVEREIGAKTVFDAFVSNSESDYQGSTLTNKTTSTGVGIKHYVSDHVFYGADYRFTHRDSNEAVYDYYRNQLMFTLGYGPKRNFGSAGGSDEVVASLLELMPDTNFGGLYIGGMLGHDSFGTQTVGASGGSGSTDTGPMGDLGLTSGLFLGYNFKINQHWLVAPELEVEHSNASWFHTKDKSDANTTSASNGDSVGLGVRVGYEGQSGSVIYGRLGQVRTDVHSYYGENAAPAGAYNQTDTLTGTRYGIGTDVPASNNMFVRLDYTYTDYGSFNAPYATTGGTVNEQMSNEETLFRLGLGWKFGGHLPKAKVYAAPVSGFYVGAALGHGSLDSQVDGIQNDSSGCTNCYFTGAFADIGSSAGLFGGYGWAFNRWYLGLELEADANGPHWQHEISGTSGRDFSAAKKGDLGYAVRVGYTLPNGVLLYGRVGEVNAKFNTTWVKGGNSSAWVDRDDKIKGNRLGLGAEIPVGAGYTRFDYTYTVYDKYSFVTTQAQPDSMTFANSESLFRLGLGYRF